VNINKHLDEERVISYSICLFGFFPILPESLKGLPVIILFVFALFFYLQKKKKGINYLIIIYLSSLFLIKFLSVFYSGSLSFPINKMETTLALLVIPLSFCFIDKDYLNTRIKLLFIKCFIISALALSLISFYFYYTNNLFDGFLRVNSFRKLIMDIPIVGDHPIYVSLFTGISILFSITIFEASERRDKLILIISIIIQTLQLFLLSSKGVILGLLVSIILFALLQLKKRRIKIIVVFSILSLFFTSIFLFPSTERRFREFWKKTTYTELHVTNSSSIRVSIYQCALVAIKKKPVLGYGWGEGEKELKRCYKNKSNFLYSKNYNSHNQFFDYYLDAGILGIIVLLFFLLIQFKKAIGNKDYLYQCLVLFFSLVMLTENILNRQSGVIIFIFIISFFYFANFKSEPNLG
jgi:O-antigen ligase